MNSCAAQAAFVWGFIPFVIGYFIEIDFQAFMIRKLYLGKTSYSEFLETRTNQDPNRPLASKLLVNKVQGTLS
jgi:hypothetical protein